MHPQPNTQPLARERRFRRRRFSALAPSHVQVCRPTGAWAPKVSTALFSTFSVPSQLTTVTQQLARDWQAALHKNTDSSVYVPSISKIFVWQVFNDCCAYHTLFLTSKNPIFLSCRPVPRHQMSISGLVEVYVLAPPSRSHAMCAPL